MTHDRLDDIVTRQRRYLIMDVLMAALAGIIFILQVSVLGGAKSAFSSEPAHIVCPAGGAPWQRPDVMQPGQDEAVAASDEVAPTPGS